MCRPATALPSLEEIKSKPLSEASCQEIQRELIRRRRFNAFDGERVLSLLGTRMVAWFRVRRLDRARGTMDTPGTSNRDYYQILGVLRTATAADISSAYHLLARRHHPDVSPANPDSLAQIKLVNEAYEVLSDVEKRREYDRRHRSRSTPESLSRGFPQQPRPASFTPSPTPAAVAAAATAVRWEVELSITPEEARSGGPCEFTVALPETCAACAGQGQIVGVWCSVCQGRGRIRQRQRLQIRLPGGIQTGTVIRVARPDARGPASTSELWLRIDVRPCW